jgi:hypothetical protein
LLLWLRIRILRRGGLVRPAAEQFVAVLDVGGGRALFFQLVELRAITAQIVAEVLEPFGGLFFFGGVELVLG